MPPAALERKLSALLEAVLSLALFLIFAMIAALVILRYFFGAGVVGANEGATIVFVYASSLGAALAVGRDEHIRVGYLPERFGERVCRAAHTASLILVGILNIVLVERGIEWIRVTGGYLMPATQLPRLAAQISVPLGCGIAALYCFMRLTARGKNHAGGVTRPETDAVFRERSSDSASCSLPSSQTRARNPSGGGHLRPSASSFVEDALPDRLPSLSSPSDRRNPPRRPRHFHHGLSAEAAHGGCGE